MGRPPILNLYHNIDSKGQALGGNILPNVL